jgi:hypothetical protein
MYSRQVMLMPFNDTGTPLLNSWPLLTDQVTTAYALLVTTNIRENNRALIVLELALWFAQRRSFALAPSR